MSSPIALTSNATLSPKGHGWRWWITRILLGLLGLFATIALVTLVAGAIARANLQAQFPATGRLVDVGGYKLHINCQGSNAGSTVILEAGAGATSLDWALVQPEVSRFATVCAYDRAGIGWSDVSPKPRSAAVMVEELHTLLEKTGLKGPFVFVGHSIGGIVSRHYAVKYPSEVAGLVLVDSAHEQQIRRYPASVVASTTGGLNQLKIFETLIAIGIPALFPALAPLEPRLPEQVAAAHRALMISDPKQIAAGRGEIEELMKGDTPPVATLGALPLVVVSRGKAEMGMDKDTSAQTERVWTAMQLELAALSSRGQRVVATGSGHTIQLDEPSIVIDAIRQVWSAGR